MAWAAAICEEGSYEYVGVRPVPRSYFDIAGRPDAEAWYRACDVELDKLFSMGTFDIVDEAGIPQGHGSWTHAFRSRGRRTARAI